MCTPAKKFIRELTDMLEVSLSYDNIHALHILQSLEKDPQKNERYHDDMRTVLEVLKELHEFLNTT